MCCVIHTIQHENGPSNMRGPSNMSAIPSNLRAIICKVVFIATTNIR